MLVLINVLSFLCCFEIIESSSTHNYQVQTGVNINSNVDARWIISSMRKKSKFVCLAVCNSNQECLTTVYIESVATDNCFLYKKHFNSTETTTSSNTKLFKKGSKYRVSKNINNIFYFQNRILNLDNNHNSNNNLDFNHNNIIRYNFKYIYLIYVFNHNSNIFFLH